MLDLIPSLYHLAPLRKEVPSSCPVYHSIAELPSKNYKNVQASNERDLVYDP